MTDTAIANSPERQARISGYWARHRDWSFEQVAALVDTELKEEAAADAERAAYGQSMHDSYEAMTGCLIPGCTASGTDAQYGLCGPHAVTARLVQAERVAARNGNREAVAAYLDHLASVNG